MSDYKMKTGKLGEKIVGAYKKIEDAFVDAFLEEDGSMKTGGMAKKATDAYQKIEDTVVGGYKKVENAFVEAFLEKKEDADDKAEDAEKASEEEK